VNFITRHWYRREKTPPVYLRVLSRVYRYAIKKRRESYQSNRSKIYRSPVPVIVVGNISVGGTGKTPCIIALAQYLKKQNYSPGVISRGYGGKSKNWPKLVDVDSSPLDVGDEPVLIAHSTQCPVVVGPTRKDDIQLILKKHPETNIILSDDGMQHYAMARDIEIAIIDGQRLFGNGKLLPAGPLREPVSRLETVDFKLYNGAESPSSAGNDAFSMHLQPKAVYHLNNVIQTCTLESFIGQKVHAIAGIGNPQRFFDSLEKQGIEVIPHAFNDHHQFSESELNFGDELNIVMTEKDAVKCKSFNVKNCWVIAVEAQINISFYERILSRLENKNTMSENQEQHYGS